MPTSRLLNTYTVLSGGYGDVNYFVGLSLIVRNPYYSIVRIPPIKTVK
jgi:hypothetical protein